MQLFGRIFVYNNMNMKIRYTLIHILFLLAMAVPVASVAAQVKIHGKVTDQNNEPVEFVTVRIGGTAIGTNSGLEGEYSLTCPAADTITVHFLSLIHI